MLKIVVLLSVTIVSSNAFAQTRPVPIFTCHVNGKVAQVVRAGGVFVYRYGKPGAEPDIELRSTGKDGRLLFASAPAQRQLFQQLKFKNGNVEYLLYDWQTAGLAVVRNGQDISDRTCALKSDGFSDAWSSSSLWDVITEDAVEPTIR